MNIPKFGIFILDDREVKVPEDWMERFRAAEREDLMNSRLFLRTTITPWEARNREYVAFKEAVDGGLEVENWV